MNELVQVTPSATAAVQQSKVSPLKSGNTPESSDDTDGFTAVFASYVESEPGTAEQISDRNLNDLFNELLPQELLVDGNSLPESEQTAMWQALLLLQPAENAIANSNINSGAMHVSDLLDSKNKPVLNSSWLNQDYFHTLTVQNKDAAAANSAGLASNNMNTQIFAESITANGKDAILLNINEQIMPAQGTNTGLIQGLAAVGFGTATQAAITQTQMTPLNIGQNAWEANLGSRLQMLVGQNVQTAEIRLDPPELGTLDIKIKITNDIATVNIVSSHSHVREAIETAVPKLREMFEESGLSLGDVNVSQESFSQQRNSTAEEDVTFLSGIAKSEDIDESVTVSRIKMNDSLLDTYA